MPPCPPELYRAVGVSGPPLVGGPIVHLTPKSRIFEHVRLLRPSFLLLLLLAIAQPAEAQVLQGVVVADLAWGLNARFGVDEEGRTTVTSRLDPLLALEQAVLYDPDANVLISQRSLDRPTTEQRFPLRIPFRR